MSKADFVKVLKKNGLEAVEETGVVIILYEGGMREFKRAFWKARRMANEYGYTNSMGARAK